MKVELDFLVEVFGGFCDDVNFKDVVDFKFIYSFFVYLFGCV